MSSKKIEPRLIYADQDGNIYDHPELCMLYRRNDEFVLPGPKDITPLPPDSDIFLLPDRYAVGLDKSSGRIEYLDAHPVAAFACPGYTITGTTAYISKTDSCSLPLFAYGAVGYARDQFWICARQVDTDPRQKFWNISTQKIEKGCKQMQNRMPQNRLVHHLSNCALTYSCPAAKNLALGRYEAPLPTAKHCNANCVGCISKQPQNSDFPATQNRISFTPSAREISQIMFEHAKFAQSPIYSFGQGCEGEPILESATIRKAINMFRSKDGPGTVNINTNASLPQEIAPLAEAGLSSMRVSINSAREDFYVPYYQPNYSLQDVFRSIARAKELGLFVSLNYLYFPGINDSEAEFSALCDLIQDLKIDFIQLRNLNLDPELYLQTVPAETSPSMGLVNFQNRLSEQFPWLGFGYFNPYLG